MNRPSPTEMFKCLYARRRDRRRKAVSRTNRASLLNRLTGQIEQLEERVVLTHCPVGLVLPEIASGPLLVGTEDTPIRSDLRIVGLTGDNAGVRDSVDIYIDGRVCVEGNIGGAGLGQITIHATDGIVVGDGVSISNRDVWPVRKKMSH